MLAFVHHRAILILGRCNVYMDICVSKGSLQMAKLARDPVDAHVGGQVKMRRGLVVMSQTELG